MGSTPAASARRHSSRKSHPSALAVASSTTPGVQNGESTPTAATPVSAKPTATPGGAKTTLGAGVKVLPGGGGIFKSAAVAVLRIERKLMSTGDICRVALERGLLQAKGKTPEATMASALYTDVKRKERNSIFTRPQEGLFGLQEWEDEGFVPEAMIPGGGGTAPAAIAAAAAHVPKPGPKRDRDRRSSRQRSGRHPWHDDDGTETDSPSRGTDMDSPVRRDKRHIAMTELPGKQRLKHALKLQQEREDSASGRDTPTSGHPAEAEGRRKKPRLQVEVPGSAGPNIHLSNGGSLKSPHPDLLHGLDASRLIGSGGGIGMEGPGLGSTFLPLSLESGAAHMLNTSSSLLRSPLDAAILGALDTPALMNMPIPDGLPLTPEGLAAAAIRSGLTPRWGLGSRTLASPGPLSTRWQQMQGGGSGLGQAGGSASQLRPPEAPGASPHPALRSAAAAAETSSAQWQAAAAMVAAQQQRMAAAAAGPSSSAAAKCNVDEMEKRVIMLENSLGRGHPQVGKAWVFLGRTIQAVGGPGAGARAERALVKAREILYACAKQVRRSNASADESFNYLLEKLRTLGAPAEEARQ
eukprot:jgi/Tetstr1/447977/TSEL_035281.t1